MGLVNILSTGQFSQSIRVDDKIETTLIVWTRQKPQKTPDFCANGKHSYTDDSRVLFIVWGPIFLIFFLLPSTQNSWKIKMGGIIRLLLFSSFLGGSNANGGLRVSNVFRLLFWISLYRTIQCRGTRSASHTHKFSFSSLYRVEPFWIRTEIQSAWTSVDHLGMRSTVSRVVPLF